MGNLRNNQDHLSGLMEEILKHLQKQTGGRPLANTAELGHMSDTAPQTIRRNHSERGEFLGIRPIKLGNRLFWPLAEIARVLSGRTAEGGRARSITKPRLADLNQKSVAGGEND